MVDPTYLFCKLFIYLELYYCENLKRFIDSHMYPKEETEKKWVEKIIEGDEEAFCRLYAFYKDKLTFFALKFLKSHQLVEDIYQDAFAVIWQNRRFLNPDMPFGGYIYTIVKNRIFNLLISLDKEQRLKDKIRSGSMDYNDETENTILEADLNELLEKALENLTSQQRKIFIMSRNDMMSRKEIAESLGISVYTVQQHISASLKIIRAYLKKYADTYVTFLLFSLLNI